jgi:hypothetical protein
MLSVMKMLSCERAGGASKVLGRVCSLVILEHCGCEEDVKRGWMRGWPVWSERLKFPEMTSREWNLQDVMVIDGWLQ